MLLEVRRSFERNTSLGIASKQECMVKKSLETANRYFISTPEDPHEWLVKGDSTVGQILVYNHASLVAILCDVTGFVTPV